MRREGGVLFRFEQRLRGIEGGGEAGGGGGEDWGSRLGEGQALAADGIALGVVETGVDVTLIFCVSIGTVAAIGVVSDAAARTVERVEAVAAVGTIRFLPGVGNFVAVGVKDVASSGAIRVMRIDSALAILSLPCIAYIAATIADDRKFVALTVIYDRCPRLISVSLLGQERVYCLISKGLVPCWPHSTLESAGI